MGCFSLTDQAAEKRVCKRSRRKVNELILPRYFVASKDTVVKYPSLTDECFCANGTLGAVRRSGGKQQGEGNVQVLKLVESPKLSQNVEISAVESVLISSARPPPKI